MQKTGQKIISFLLAVVLLMGMSMTALAEEETAVFDVSVAGETEESVDYDFADVKNFSQNPGARVAMITQVGMSGLATAEGLYLSMGVTANENATQIGVKDIIVQKKVSWGWQNVATSSGNYVTNSNMFQGTALVDIKYMEVGQTYRILSTYYAYLSNGYTEVPNQSDSFVFTY